MGANFRRLTLFEASVKCAVEFVSFSRVPILTVLVRSFLEALSSLNSKNPETLDWRQNMCTYNTSRYGAMRSVSVSV